VFPNGSEFLLRGAPAVSSAAGASARTAGPDESGGYKENRLRVFQTSIIKYKSIKKRTVMKRSLHHVGHLLLGMAAIALFGVVFRWLWNALLPQIFGVVAIDYRQALGLLVLLAGLSKFMVVAAFLGMRGYRRNPIHDKWMKMTPEERRKFVKNRHFGHGFGHDFFDHEASEKEN
jgi:hypothetical protein